MYAAPRCMPNVKQFRKQAEAASAAYAASIAQVAHAARAELVPYFTKRGWALRVGNGVWGVRRVDAQDPHKWIAFDKENRHKVPLWVREILNMPLLEREDILAWHIGNIN